MGRPPISRTFIINRRFSAQIRLLLYPLNYLWSITDPEKVWLAFGITLNCARKFCSGPGSMRLILQKMGTRHILDFKFGSLIERSDTLKSLTEGRVNLINRLKFNTSYLNLYNLLPIYKNIGKITIILLTNYYLLPTTRPSAYSLLMIFSLKITLNSLIFQS
jgi:hypothetical protein